MVLTSTHNLRFEEKYEKFKICFVSENVPVLVVTSSIYLNRRVFVMDKKRIMAKQTTHTYETTGPRTKKNWSRRTALVEINYWEGVGAGVRGFNQFYSR